MSVVFERAARNVCSILINRPAKRNALNHDLIKQLQNALHKFEQDDQYLVAILAGAGGHFCAGYDLNEVINPKSGQPKIQAIQEMLWPLGTRLSCDKFVIAAIDGCAAGFGYELALKCDFRIAERDSRMGFLNRRFGFPIMNGGTVILPRMVGQGRSLELIATGKAQLAQDALNYGLLSFVVDIGCATGRALALARNIAKFDQESLRHDMKQIKSDEAHVIELLTKERNNSLRFLSQCAPFDLAVKFLEGKICRHGNSDLGNLLEPTPEMSL